MATPSTPAPVAAGTAPEGERLFALPLDLGDHTPETVRHTMQRVSVAERLCQALRIQAMGVGVVHTWERMNTQLAEVRPAPLERLVVVDCGENATGRRYWLRGWGGEFSVGSCGEQVLEAHGRGLFRPFSDERPSDRGLAQVVHTLAQGFFSPQRNPHLDPVALELMARVQRDFPQGMTLAQWKDMARLVLAPEDLAQAQSARLGRSLETGKDGGEKPRL